MVQLEPLPTNHHVPISTFQWAGRESHQPGPAHLSTSVPVSVISSTGEYQASASFRWRLRPCDRSDARRLVIQMYGYLISQLKWSVLN